MPSRIFHDITEDAGCGDQRIFEKVVKIRAFFYTMQPILGKGEIMLMRKISFCAIVLILAAPMSAADIYVCVARGSNGNPGTIAEPLKNIDKVLGMAQAGDVIRAAGKHLRIPRHHNHEVL